MKTYPEILMELRMATREEKRMRAMNPQPEAYDGVVIKSLLALIVLFGIGLML